ncbi:MAG: GGDEF domain-containing protein [Rhodoferax sp.]|jgi:diguanylate cyclase|nr:GGDEF domain-containing protein [Rhodoferax sp.]
MNYSESKEKSAEILRAVIGQMARHDASFNPVTFAVWYEHLAGINPGLSEALNGAIARLGRLGDDSMRQLFDAHVAPPEHQVMNQVAERFQKTMTGMSDSATRTGQDAGKFGEQLSRLAQALESPDVDTLSPHIVQARENASEMRQSAQALERQVAQSRQEIAVLQAELGRVRQEALLCPLTRVLNRRGFDQTLQAILDGGTAPDKTHCLVMLDIDHFKKVNDTHGHVMGDRVIQAMGEVMRACVTGQNGTSLARYGGEEFAVLLPDTPIHVAESVAENIRQKVKALKMRNRQTQEVVLTFTVSAGVTRVAQGDKPDTLIARADSALYQSKQNGRDRVTCA